MNNFYLGMLNTPLLTHRFLRLFTPRIDYRGICEKHWVIENGSVNNTRPAIMIPGQLDKVTGVHKETTLSQEYIRIRGGRVEHAPTIAYDLGRSFLRGPTLYKGPIKKSLQPGPEKFYLNYAPVEIKEGAIACSYNGNRYFGHWLTDDITQGYLASEYSLPITTQRIQYQHEPGFSNIFNYHPDQIHNANINKCIVFQDFAQNASKRRRYEILRDCVCAQFPPSNFPGAMILRGKSGKGLRLLENESEIAEICESRGFVIIDPQNLTVEQVMKNLSGTNVVVGVEGSQLAPAVYALKVGAAIVTLQPPNLFNNVFKDYADCLDMHYGLLVGSARPMGFHIDIEEFQRTLDLIMGEAC